jgi:hypothetical protein
MKIASTLIIVTSLLLVGLVLGCTAIPNSIDNTNDIIMNPAKYNNQNVTVIAHPFASTIFGNYPYPDNTYEGSNYYIETEDKEGKPVKLGVSYEKFYCDTCKIEGIIKTHEWCACSACNNHVCIKLGQVLVSNCAGSSGCSEEPQVSYYIEVIDVTKN